jgi:hypothetical protein
MPYVVTSATTKPTRLFTTPTGSFSYRTIKKEAFAGYSLVEQNQKSFLIADKEKALVDYLYFVSLKKNIINERLTGNLKNPDYHKSNSLSKKKILMYAKLFENKQLLNLISIIL